MDSAFHIHYLSTRGEEYDRMSYIYTPTLVQLALNNVLELDQRATIGLAEYLDIFTK